MNKITQQTIGHQKTINVTTTNIESARNYARQIKHTRISKLGREFSAGLNTGKVYVVVLGLLQAEKDILSINEFFESRGWGKLTYVMEFKTLPDEVSDHLPLYLDFTI